MNLSKVEMRWLRLFAVTVCFGAAALGRTQAFPHTQMVHFQQESGDFPLAQSGHAAAIYIEPTDAASLGAAVDAFALDVQRVSGRRPRVLSSLQAPLPETLVIVGVVGHSAEIDRLRAEHKLDVTQIEHKWESAAITVVSDPMPGVRQALLIAGSDRRGAAFALFNLSREMGVSPWAWWADVQVPHHDAIAVRAAFEIQPEPSVQYRGIFLNDEDWGLRPWASKKMDPQLNNIGPRTYERVFELLLRLHANTLWPAMHPGTLPFNAVAQNAQLADRWGIVMGSSHSEALLRNNVGEWNEKTDGPWNYQVNRAAMDAYWAERLAANGKYENFYTVGLRGVHDTGLEATGSVQVKARLVEQAMADQRAMLTKIVNPDLTHMPQVIWLYKESLDLYRAGMKVPDDVTLGWTDDNFGYLRQLPTVEEQQRAGGSGIYYHVSYYGFPHDYLWLCTTPPALVAEEMTKAYDHGARRYWILNVGDLKPAEADIDFFMQLAWNEPAMAQVDQKAFLKSWAAEQFPVVSAAAIADVMDRYYVLNFIRKPEHMGFNGYNDGINRTAFNPLAWGDQNQARIDAWKALQLSADKIGNDLPEGYGDAFFELVQYPVDASAAMNYKFLFTDRSFLDAAQAATPTADIARQADAARAHAAYDEIQKLTVQYGALKSGKWEGMMSASPRDRQVFMMPVTATSHDDDRKLPADWGAAPLNMPPAPMGVHGFVEQAATVSMNAAHFSASHDGTLSRWRVLPDLGISGGSVLYGAPGVLAETPEVAGGPDSASPWLEYSFTTVSSGPATLAVELLPVFPVDAQHHLRYAVAMDGGTPKIFDLAGSGEWQEGAAPVWEDNVRRNFASVRSSLGDLKPGAHTLRFSYVDPGVVFEHLVVTFAGAPPAYPVPPETRTP